MGQALPLLPMDGFEQALRRIGRAAVCFTADWCPHCRRFAPLFAEAAGTSQGMGFAIADISDDDTDPRWDRYAIEVVPTVLVFEDGAPIARLDGILGRGIDRAQLSAFLQGEAGQQTV